MKHWLVGVSVWILVVCVEVSVYCLCGCNCMNIGCVGVPCKVGNPHIFMMQHYCKLKKKSRVLL